MDHLTSDAPTWSCPDKVKIVSGNSHCFPLALVNEKVEGETDSKLSQLNLKWQLKGNRRIWHLIPFIFSSEYQPWSWRRKLLQSQRETSKNHVHSRAFFNKIVEDRNYSFGFSFRCFLETKDMLGLDSWLCSIVSHLDLTWCFNRYSISINRPLFSAIMLLRSNCIW